MSKKQKFLNSLDTKTLTNQQSNLCKNELRGNDLCESMESMKNKKTTGNDRLTKEFSETFWNELKTPQMECISRAFCTKILNI